MIRTTIAAVLLLFCCTISAFAQDMAIPAVSVSASADDGNVAANVIDGDLTTRWSAQGDGQWLQIDLGGAKAVVGVRLAWFRGDQRVSSFDLQASLDDVTWQTVYVGQSSGATADLEAFRFGAVQARYVRYVGHGNSVNDWNSVTEMQGLGEAPVPPEPPTLKTVTARWTDDINEKVDGYRLYYGVQSGTYAGHVEVGDVREATVAVPVLADKMVFAITAFLGDKESDYSEEITVDMTTPKPEVTLSVPTLNEVIVQ